MHGQEERCCFRKLEWKSSSELSLSELTIVGSWYLCPVSRSLRKTVFFCRTCDVVMTDTWSETGYHESFSSLNMG